jgi:hypothetical protein
MKNLPFERLRDRSGFALPLALIGLLLATVLIVGTVVTAASESALSYAHRDATQSLYIASGSLEAYVAARGGVLAPVSEVFTAPGEAEAVQITVERLSLLTTPIGDFEVFAVTAVPVAGGRSVTAMVELAPFQLGVESAATFGGDSRIGGSTIVSDGRDSESCSLPAAENAVVHGEGTSVDTIGNNVSVVGGVQESDVSGAELIKRTLGGYSIEELARHVQGQGLSADKIARFGTNQIWGSSEDYKGVGNDKPASWHKVGNQDEAKAATDGYNWNCPGWMDTSATRCFNIAGTDSINYKIMMVDAGGTEITIQGDHGQGLLMVMNGGIRISVGFIFRGLIVSTHDIDITGTGNKVEGAIVSQNELRVDRPADSESDVLGNAVVRFNRCAVDAVTKVIDGGGMDRRLSLTFGWTELVR